VRRAADGGVKQAAERGPLVRVQPGLVGARLGGAQRLVGGDEPLRRLRAAERAAAAVD